MKKTYKKIFRTKIIILQGLYACHINKSYHDDLNKLFFENKNRNKIDCNYIVEYLTFFIKKDKCLNILFYKNVNNFFKISLLESLIIKMIIFDIFVYKFFALNIILSNALHLSNKFCSKTSYNLIKNISYNVIICYMIFKLIN